MRAHEILFEHILNIRSRDEKERFAPDIWQLLAASYEKIGGFHTATNIEELIEKSGLWKIVTRNGKISAFKMH
ncbi:Uncharacterised protein [uncultured archaeon]|nr:Uncharacterised protein [uncultured archaeon]